MKESVSFSGKETENTSLNFTELREKGLEYIQKLSGDIWTDYNSHDPGVTILEQLCYALTDIAFRTSLPVKDLLTPGKDAQIDPKNNAYLTPSSILSSHPVTLNDTRKILIDGFDEIQNAWIITKEIKGYEEQMRGINQIEILPKLTFVNAIKSDQSKKQTFLNRVNNFLSENRSLAENFEKACLLEPQNINIEFDIFISEKEDVEVTISKLFLALLEFIYCPVRFQSFNEMKELGYTMEMAFSGPKLKNGFIKDDILKDRIKSIHIDELQKLFSKVKGINKSVVKPFIVDGKEADFMDVEDGKFFHLLIDSNSINIVDHRFDQIYKNMSVFVNNKKVNVLNKQKIINLFYEAWSKKNRGYPIGKSLNEFFYEKLKGTYRKPDEYYSIQRHFPIIYGIGEEGLSKNDTAERHAKANQLKAYLMLFEQHLANHLSQLGNLNEFFNIDFENGSKRTYFTQWLSSIPNVEKLATKNIPAIESYLEPKNKFFDRKNRIYDHLLARFGEELSDVPWKISMRLNLIQTEEDLNRILLQQKSQFLMHLEKLTYNRMKGESFQPENPEDETPKYKWVPSGLEEIILLKTGISQGRNKTLVPEFFEFKSHLHILKEDSFKDSEELNDIFRPISTEEIRKSIDINQDNKEIPNAVFGKIGLKSLFKATVRFQNFRISRPKSTTENFKVIFQKEENKWVSLFECATEGKAIHDIGQIIAYFINQNSQSEGIYIVDHILLNDFLKDSKFGFSFIDEYGTPLFRTIDDESWTTSEEERDKQVNKLYNFKKEKCSYNANNGNFVIKDKKEKILATCETARLNQLAGNDVFNELLKKLKSFIRLFNTNENSNGRLRLKELEKLRLMGSLVYYNYGQRRLVFQRKLPSGEIIDEDFFNQKICFPIGRPDFRTNNLKLMLQTFCMKGFHLILATIFIG